MGIGDFDSDTERDKRNDVAEVLINVSMRLNTVNVNRLSAEFL
jgi:hypothetical protein